MNHFLHNCKGQMNIFESLKYPKVTGDCGDDNCPCNDGDICNYEDDEFLGKKTYGFPNPPNPSKDFIERNR